MVFNKESQSCWTLGGHLPANTNDGNKFSKASWDVPRCYVVQNNTNVCQHKNDNIGGMYDLLERKLKISVFFFN